MFLFAVLLTPVLIHAAPPHRPVQSLALQLQADFDDKIALESYKNSSTAVYFIAAYRSNVPISRRAIGPSRYHQFRSQLRALLMTKDEKDCPRPLDWWLQDSKREVHYLFCPARWPGKKRDRLEKILSEIHSLLGT